MTQESLKKEDLLKAIDKLEKNPSDRVGIVTGLGVTATGAIGAGAVAAVAGATTTSLPLITAVTGVGLFAAAPVALVAGAAVAGGVTLFGAAKLIQGSGFLNGKRNQIKQSLKEKVKGIETEEKKGSISNKDKTDFYALLKKPVELDLITSEDALQLMQSVEGGQMGIVDAVRLVKEIVVAHTESQKAAA